MGPVDIFEVRVRAVWVSTAYCVGNTLSGDRRSLRPPQQSKEPDNEDIGYCEKRQILAHKEHAAASGARPPFRLRVCTNVLIR